MAAGASTSTSYTIAVPFGPDTELLELLREELDTEEQRMFLDGFTAYLSCDARRDFVVDLDDVYEWMGFTRKDHAKTKLTKTLVEGKDYTIINSQFFAPAIAGAKTDNDAEADGRGGHNKERIMMTVHGFKRLCMAAGTEKAARVQQYYLTMEEVVFEHTRRKMLETAKLLEDKERAATDAAVREAKLTVELDRYRTKTYEEVPRLDKVYIDKDRAQLGTDKHKLGTAVDENKREATFNTSSAEGSKMIYTLEVSNGKLVEDTAKHALKRYHHAREHYNCRVEHTVDVFDIAGTVVDTLASSYEFMTRDELFDKVIDKLQAKRVQNVAPLHFAQDEEGAGKHSAPFS